MRSISWSALACFLLLQGCMPRTITIHDGLDTTVVDAVTKEGIAGAFVFSSRGESMSMIGNVLAKSGANGHIHLEPETTTKFVALMSEGLVDQSLVVCKEGYDPNRVARRGGWNADFSPSKLHEIKQVELTKSISTESSSVCRVNLQQ